MLKQVLQILPREAAQALDGLNAAQVEEIRLRCGQVPSILRRGVEQPLPHCERTPQQELQRTLLAASAQSQYAVQEQLREGFLSVPGGVRIGVCGSAVVQDGRVTGIREISSLCIRIPHEIRHPPEQLLPLLSASCLLAGRPGSGKTTLLRSCIRALSAAGQPRRRCGRAAGAVGRGAWRAAVRPRPAHGRALRLPEGRRHADAAARDEPGVAGRGRDHKSRRPRRDPAGLRLRRAHPCDDPRGLRRGAAGKIPVPGRPRGRDV